MLLTLFGIFRNLPGMTGGLVGTLLSLACFLSAFETKVW